MRRILPCLLLLGLSTSCRVTDLAVWYPGLDQPRFLRVNLRSTSGVFLRSSSVLSREELLPMGSPATIARLSEEEVDLMVHETLYTMYPVGGTFDTSEPGVRALIDKYFVDAEPEAAIGSDTPPELAAKIRRGEVLKGMTKEQVYAALGPPEWVDEAELPAVRRSRSSILKSDRWTYTWRIYVDLVPRKVVYLFEGGKLLDIEQ